MDDHPPTLRAIPVEEPYEVNRLKDRDAKLTKPTELTADIRFGVMTTIGEDGSLWSRPVSTQQASPNGEIRLFAKRDLSWFENIVS